MRSHRKHRNTGSGHIPIPAKETADKESLIEEVFQEIIGDSCPFQELRDPQIKAAFDLAMSDDFEVCVVATMSAGKSSVPWKTTSKSLSLYSSIKITGKSSTQSCKRESKAAFDLAMSDDFEVCVVATMSAGKSTLINAMLGSKLMPSKQEACTAIITRIKDEDCGDFRLLSPNSHTVGHSRK